MAYKKRKDANCHNRFNLTKTRQKENAQTICGMQTTRLQCVFAEKKLI